MGTTKQTQTPIKMIAAVVALVAAIVFLVLYTFRGSGSSVPGTYYFDLNTRKVFVVPGSSFAPIETDSGPHEGDPAGVRLFIFSCTPQKNLAGLTLEEVRAKGAFPLWFEKYTPEAKQLLQEGDNRPEVIMDGLRMRPVDGAAWMSPNSREAVALRNSVQQLCPNGKASACAP